MPTHHPTMGLNRNSNIEFLRILAMLAIVCGHLVAALPLDSLSGVNLVWANLLGSGLRIAVNVFVMIGAWFLVDATFRFDRVFRLYLAIVCYSLASIVLSYAVGDGPSSMDLVRYLLPFWGANFWFVTVYIILLLLAPLLNAFFAFQEKAQALALALVGVYCVFYATCPYPQHGSMERFLGWFVYLYLLTGFIKHCLFARIRKHGKALICVAAATYFALVAARCSHGALARLAYQYTYDVIALPNFLCALALFLGFACRSSRENRIVNILARPILGVYLAHLAFACLYSPRAVEWLRSQGHSPFFCGSVILCAGSVFLICEVVDLVRIRLIESPMRNCTVYQLICVRVESFYAGMRPKTTSAISRAL